MISPSGSVEDSKKKSRQERRSGKTRKKLMEAAKTVLAEKGLSAATVEDITDRADVGRGSFYYHFDAKDELIRQMMEKLLAELNAAMRESCAPHTEINAVLDAMIGAHIKFFSSRWEDFVLYHQGRADIMLIESLEGIETPFLDYLNCIEELVAKAVSQPISKERLPRLAWAIAGFISGYYSFASVASEEVNVDESFMALRSAFVVSLVRFIKEALPQL
jgi:AcrR family transcriptional regulator